MVRDKRLRWPIPEHVENFVGALITQVERRAKYLILHTDKGYLILHLGMSGKLRVVPSDSLVVKHDHFDLQLTNGQCLRFNDARRFGSVLVSNAHPSLDHPLLRELGPEPLTEAFTADYLHRQSRGKQQSIKTFIMDNHVVVGSAIFTPMSRCLKRIHPKRAAGKVSLARYQKLVPIIKEILTAAIAQGGTTLQDFTQADGSPGYFKQQLNVYGRVASVHGV